MKLNKYYSIDECNDEEALLEKLDELQDEAKIDYERLDKWTLKIEDLDLTTSEEKKLVEYFESLGLYETQVDEDEDDDFEDPIYDDFDDYDDDSYKTRKKSSRDDDWNDF